MQFWMVEHMSIVVFWICANICERSRFRICTTEKHPACHRPAKRITSSLYFGQPYYLSFGAAFNFKFKFATLARQECWVTFCNEKGF